MHCREGPGYFSSWSISSLTIIPDCIFFPLLPPPTKFFGLILLKQIHLRFLGKLFPRVSSKFPRDSVDNSYCKEEVNVFKITQIRLQKIKKWSYSKILLPGDLNLEKIVCCCYKKAKMTCFVLFLKGTLSDLRQFLSTESPS